MPTPGTGPNWLLVGNSRWHWAEATPAGVTIQHREAAAMESCGPVTQSPWAWAAVGALPAGQAPDPARRVVTADVPLADLPPWLGVDRALAGWMAWRQRQESVLVADAGTVLSLTWVDSRGRFRGGRLIAGLGLQLRAMAEGTAALPAPPAPDELETLLSAGRWPALTEAAMAVGVSQALAAVLCQSLRELRASEPHCRLVLTGGDAPTLLPLIREQQDAAGDAVALEPDLALRGLVELRPEGREGAQASDRSASS